MKRFLMTYAVFLAAIGAGGIMSVMMLQSTGTGGALAKLSRSERDFLDARQQLLLNADDPSGALIRYATDPRKSQPGRTRALSLLQQLATNQSFPVTSEQIGALMKDSSRAVRMQTLAMLEQMKTTAGVRYVVAAFASAPDTEFFGQATRTLKAISDSLDLILTNAFAQSDSARVDSLLRIQDSIPVGKGRAFQNAARYYAQHGNYARASLYNRRPGFIKKWWVTGGWENQKMRAFYETLPPETHAFDAAETFTVMDGKKMGWAKFSRTGEWGYFDPTDLMPQKQFSVAYFAAFLLVPTERDALIQIGSDDGIRVWINDSLFFSNRVFRGVTLDNDIFRIHLRPGPNYLLIKVAQDLGGWGILCRLTDCSGEAMPDVQISLSPAPETSPAQTILAAMQKGGDSWKQRIVSLARDDDEIAQGLISYIVDENELSATRIAALRILSVVNTQRSVPAGEEEIVNALNKQLDRAIFDATTRAMLQYLTGIGSTRSLEPALSARQSADTLIRYYANRLISLYCLGSIRNAGNPSSPPYERMIHEIESVNPEDGLVRSAIARFYASKDESEKARAAMPGLAMPKQWCIGLTAPQSKQIAVSSICAQVWADSSRAPAGWKRYSPTAERGIVSPILRTAGPAVNTFICMIFSDNADTIVLHIGMLFPKPIGINNQPCLPIGAEDQPKRGPMNDFNQAANGFQQYRIRLNAGENSLVIMPGGVLRDGQEEPGQAPISFTNTQGQALWFDGNAIKHQEKK